MQRLLTPAALPIVKFVLQDEHGNFLAFSEDTKQYTWIEMFGDKTMKKFDTPLEADVILRRLNPKGFIRVTINDRLR